MPTWPLLGDTARPSYGWVTKWSPHYPHLLLSITILFSPEHVSQPKIIYLVTTCLCLQNVRFLRAHLRVYLEQCLNT